MSKLPSVQLRLPGGSPPLVIAPRADFASEAVKWSYIARSRDRWTATTDPGEGADGPLRGYLSKAQLQQLADAGLVEVGFASAADEKDDWPLRVFPWEYALSAATRGLRGDALTVVRHLQAGTGGPARALRLDRPAIVETAPGELARWYDTAVEGDLMLSRLGLDPATVTRRIAHPTRAQLADWLLRERPDLLHIAGVDAHQAIALLGLEATYPPRRQHDGLTLKNSQGPGEVEFVESEELAALLAAPSPPPELVVFNVYNSAPRLAARCVALGARHAIGYHDVIDDGLAALFCSTLYGRLAETRGDLLAAFRAGLESLRSERTPMRGAGVVLWSRVSLIDARPAARAGRATASRPPSGGRATPPAEVPASQRISVICQPKALFNYSLLHNRQSLFRTLQVFRGNVAGPIRNIQVEVALHDGEAVFPYRKTFELKDGQTRQDLTDEVVLPLTSSLLRTQSERIQSSLSLLVKCEGEIAVQETFRIGLSPVDEWVDGGSDEWRWLPSFVLPRDPAVARIIDSAQGILCALADDPTAGFDGYQSVDPAARSDEERYGCVDKQVQAIWYALLDQHGLSYINPPPSYGGYTQRLRTPSQLLDERRGTCIDLALLLAACLEYVDIYPVVFLLTGHAFAGYWRSSEQHAAFLEMKGLELMFGDEKIVAAAAAGSRSAVQQPGWVLGPGEGELEEVRRHVRQRALVPLEATWLTARGGFLGSVVEGRNNLRSTAEFQAMIDVRLARDRGVTPLPLIGGSRR